MNEHENKYDRFKQFLNDNVRTEHRYLIEPLMKLAVVDVLLLIRHGPRNISMSRDMVMKAIGLTPEIINSYDKSVVVRIERYLEYFHIIANSR